MKRVEVLGASGSGKTTAVRWLLSNNKNLMHRGKKKSLYDKLTLLILMFPIFFKNIHYFNFLLEDERSNIFKCLACVELYKREKRKNLLFDEGIAHQLSLIHFFSKNKKMQRVMLTNK